MSTTIQPRIFQIPIKSNLTTKKFAYLREKYPNLDGYSVIWVDTQTLLKAYHNTQEFYDNNQRYEVGKPLQWPNNRLHEMIDKLCTDQPLNAMPTPVVLCSKIKLKKWETILSKFGSCSEFRVDFGDGVHRSFLLRELGARKIPVTVQKSDAALVRDVFGVMDEPPLHFLDL